MDEQTPDFAKEMVEDLEHQIAHLETILRQKRETLAGVKLEYMPRSLTSPFTQRRGRAARQTVDLGTCPLSVEEMRDIGNRHAIIWEITRRHPQGEVVTAHAADWLRQSGVVQTNRTNLIKTLNRALRKDPRYVETETGSFRRRDLDREQEYLGRSSEPTGSSTLDNGGEIHCSSTT